MECENCPLLTINIDYCVVNTNTSEVHSSSDTKSDDGCSCSYTKEVYLYEKKRLSTHVVPTIDSRSIIGPVCFHLHTNLQCDRTKASVSSHTHKIIITAWIDAFSTVVGWVWIKGGVTPLGVR